MIQLTMFAPIEIQLTKDHIAVIDPIDADLTLLKWFSAEHKHGTYAIRKPTTGTVRLHRVVMERVLGRPLVKGEIVDHIDGNTLNNCRNNLRVCTYSQNHYNRKKYENSQYKGICYVKRQGKWIAGIKVNRKRIYLGAYETPEEAHEAYKTAALKYAGEFARFE